MSYLEYEELVIEAIEEIAEVDRSDAQGIIDVIRGQCFIQVGFMKALNPVHVATTILMPDEEL